MFNGLKNTDIFHSINDYRVIIQTGIRKYFTLKI